MTKPAVSDEQILSDAVRLVNEGLAVTMLVKGRSMLPFILGGRESVVLTRPGTVKPGDVVLARIDGRRYVLHRVMEVSADKVVLMGDGNIRGQEICTPADVLACRCGATCWPSTNEPSSETARYNNIRHETQRRIYTARSLR